jgi:CubicO group peptidase (beta-lactamase class C family)
MNGTTRVLPEGWVAYSITPAPSVAAPTSRVLDAGPGPGGSYGATWWLNAATPTSTSDTWEYPDEPVDGFNAEGHYGQKLVVIPSRQLVIARVGADLVTTYDPDAMIQAAVAAVDAATGKAGP